MRRRAASRRGPDGRSLLLGPCRRWGIADEPATSDALLAFVQFEFSTFPDRVARGSLGAKVDVGDPTMRPAQLSFLADRERPGGFGRPGIARESHEGRIGRL